MKFETLDNFFKKHLRFKQHWKKKVITMSDAVWQELEEDTYLNDDKYAKGSAFKIFETTNFGWIIFHPDTLTPEGARPNRRIIKY